MKCCAFQTIRPVVLRKKRCFSAHLCHGGAVLPPRVSPFFKGETLQSIFSLQVVWGKRTPSASVCGNSFLPVSVTSPSKLLPTGFCTARQRCTSCLPKGIAWPARLFFFAFYSVFDIRQEYISLLKQRTCQVAATRDAINF